MTKIKELLKPGESVLKKQRGITVHKGASDLPSGDLFLTNKRLIFLRRKRWALLSPVPATSLKDEDIQIPLEDIKAIEKSMGNIKIKSSTPTIPLKEYQFATAVWHPDEWVESIRQAKQRATSASADQQLQSQMPPSIIDNLDEHETARV